MSDFAGWYMLNHEQVAKLAEAGRPRMVQLAVGMGARTPDEVVGALEYLVACCQAELAADEPTPIPNRAQRRRR